MDKPKINAASKVRAAFLSSNKPLTITDIRVATQLEAPQISMAVCYLMKQRYLTREIVNNPLKHGRKQIWRYTYHKERLNVSSI